jgi:hypothetical protein
VESQGTDKSSGEDLSTGYRCSAITFGKSHRRPEPSVDGLLGFRIKDSLAVAERMSGVNQVPSAGRLC